MRSEAGLLSALILVVFEAVGATVASSEYRLKAAFLLNFADFVEWPANAFAGSDGPIVFGVFGRDPFDGALQEGAKSKTINGRRIVIHISSDPNVLTSCQVIFFPGSEMRAYTRIAETLSGLNILTVGESGDFTERGGIINLVIQDGHLRFQINSPAAALRHLKMSSRLLQLAVKEPPK